MSETDLVRAILGALHLKRVWAWRVNAGLTVIGKGKDKRVIRGAPPGTPDILGVLPGGRGRLFGFEAKTAKGRLSPDQRCWHEQAEGAGVRVAVVRSVSEALSHLEGWREGRA